MAITNDLQIANKLVELKVQLEPHSASIVLIYWPSMKRGMASPDAKDDTSQ